MFLSFQGRSFNNSVQGGESDGRNDSWEGLLFRVGLCFHGKGGSLPQRLIWEKPRQRASSAVQRSGLTRRLVHLQEECGCAIPGNRKATRGSNEKSTKVGLPMTLLEKIKR